MAEVLMARLEVLTATLLKVLRDDLSKRREPLTQ